MSFLVFICLATAPAAALVVAFLPRHLYAMLYFYFCLLLHKSLRAPTYEHVVQISLSLSFENCALCYTQASSAGPHFIQGLRSGIIVLIIPPMFMSVGITILGVS